MEDILVNDTGQMNIHMEKIWIMNPPYITLKKKKKINPGQL